MARSFNLTAEINLRAPGNLKTIVGEIKRELGAVTANVNLKFDPKAARGLDSITKKLDTMNSILATARGNTDALNTSLQNLSSSLGNVGSTGSKASTAVNNAGIAAKQTARNIKVAASGMEEFGKQAYLAVKRFAAFSFATSGIVALTSAITGGFKAFIEYDKQLVRLQQVTGKSASELKDLEGTIRDLAQNLGVSSATLTETAVTLAQAGFSAKETKIALAALAKTELAPSFDDIRETTEGAIAAMRQFDIGAGDLEDALGSINAVAAAFAVEADDLIGAIQRTGGVFASASKGVSEGKDALNEFLAIFTSVRQTTRESAETIATGLRTIFTRIQRAKTIEQLREFGIELTDLEGKFVGPYEAVKRLSAGLRQLDPRDIRFSSIVEELGGFRQIGKVIPLIQQFTVAQEALKVAQKGQGSLTDAQVIAQKSLANQLAKVREQFLKLIADVGQSKAFQSLFQVVTSLASGLVSLAGAMKPILPILAIIGAVKGVKAIGDFGAGFFGSMSKGSAKSAGENIGSSITGNKDKERSDAVVKASEATRANTSALKNLTISIDRLNNKIGSGGGSSTLNSGGKVMAFARGGVVPGSGNRDTVPAMLQPGEFVIRKKAVQTLGASNLHKMNKYAKGGAVKISQVVGNKKAKDGDTFYANVLPTPDKFNAEFRISEWDAYETSGPSKITKKKWDEIKKYNDKIIPSDIILHNNKISKSTVSIPPETKVSPDLTAQQAANAATNSLQNKLKKIGNKGVLDSIVQGQSERYNRFLATSKKGLDIPEIYKTGRKFKVGGRVQKFMAGGVAEEYYGQAEVEAARAALAEYKRAVEEAFSLENIYFEVPEAKSIAEGITPEVYGTGIGGLAKGQPGIISTKEVRFGASSSNAQLLKDLKVMQQSMRESALKTREAELEAYAQAEESISSFKKSGLLENIDPGILSYIQETIQKLKDGTVDPEIWDAKSVKKITKKLTKPNLEAFDKLTGKDKIKVDVQGQRTQLSEVFNRILETYGSNVSPSEQSNITSKIADITLKESRGKAVEKAAAGGFIQKFMAGGATEEIKPTKISADIIKKLRDLGGKTGIVSYYPSPSDKGEDKLVGEDLREAVRAAETKASSIGLTSKQLFDSRTLGSRADGSILEGVLKTVIEKAETAKMAKQQKKADQLSRNMQAAAGGAYQFGLVSLYGPNGELGYSDVSDAKELLGRDGTNKYLTQIVRKSLPSRYADALSKIQQDIAGLPARGAEQFQYTDIFGSGGALAFDFDETLVKGADIPGKNPIDYNDLNRVKEALADAELTLLGKELAKRLIDYPKLMDSIRVLTARPQSNAPLLASKLSSLGLPIPESKITGVSGGLNKVDNLAELEMLVDDNLENIKAVQGAGKSGYLYREPQNMSAANQSSQRAISSMEGYDLEEIIKQLGVGISSDDADPLRPIDYPKGLGASANIWGIKSTLPTDTKRTNDSSALSRIWGEAQRYIIQNFADGGKAQSQDVNAVGSQLAEEFKLAKGKNAWNQLENNCLSIAQKAADMFGYVADGDSIRRQLDIFQKLRLGQNSPMGIKPTPELLAKSPSLKRMAQNPTLAASTGNIVVREGEEMMKHVSFEHKNKEYNFGAAGVDWPIALRIPLKRKDEEKLAEGGPVKLYHGTMTGPDDSVLKNIKEKGILSSIAGGYGQGSGFYVWTSKDSALKHAEGIQSGAFTTNAAKGGYKMIIELTEMLDPKNWDLDYEVQAGDVANFVFDNFEKMQSLLEKVKGVDTGSPLQDFSLRGKNADFKHPAAGKSVRQISMGFKEEGREKRKSVDTLGMDYDLRTGQVIGGLVAALKAADPTVMDAFETEFFSNIKPGQALKYVGSAPLKPSNIDVLSTQPNAPGWTNDPTQDIGLKKGKDDTRQYGLISVSQDANSILAGYQKGDQRSGYISAYKMRDYLYYVGDVRATGGFGPRLYDVAMETATANGAMLTSDRTSVSDDAKNVWETYFNSRSDVKKTPLKPDDWTRSSLIDPKLYGKEETWPPSNDPAWVLQSGYSKSPKLINDPNSVKIQEKALGGSIRRFAKGGSAEDTVPALLTPGEFVINKKAAQKIGYGQLNKLNKADKLQGYNKGGYVGYQRLFRGGVADNDAIRAQGTVLTDVKQAEKAFAMIMGQLGENIRSTILEKFKGIEDVEAGSDQTLMTTGKVFTEGTRGRAAMTPQATTIGLQIGGRKAKATTETVAHETGHIADYTLGGGKGDFASQTKGTFQFAVVEKVKKQMEQAFIDAGASSQDIANYLGTNAELFAEFFAKASPQVRAIITSTTDANEGMKALADHLGDTGYTYAGLEASDIDPSRPKNEPPKKPSLASRAMGMLSGAKSKIGSFFRPQASSAPTPETSPPASIPPVETTPPVSSKPKKKKGGLWDDEPEESPPSPTKPPYIPLPVVDPPTSPTPSGGGGGAGSPPGGGGGGGGGGSPPSGGGGGGGSPPSGGVDAKKYLELSAKAAGMSLEEFVKKIRKSAAAGAEAIQTGLERAKIELERGMLELTGKIGVGSDELEDELAKLQEELKSETDDEKKSEKRQQIRQVQEKISQTRGAEDQLASRVRAAAVGMTEKEIDDLVQKAIAAARSGGQDADVKALLTRKLDDDEATNIAGRAAAAEYGDADLLTEGIEDFKDSTTNFEKIVEYMGGPLKATTRSLLVASNVFAAGAKLFTKGTESFLGTGLSAVAEGFKGGSEGAAIVAELDIQKQLSSAGKFIEGFGGKFTVLGQGLQKFSGSIQAGALAFAAVTGAIKGFYNSIAQSRLDYSLGKLDKASQQTTEAFKNFDKNPNNAAAATMAREAMINEENTAEGLRAQGAVDVQGPRTLDWLRKWDPTGISSMGEEQEKAARKAVLDRQAILFEQSGKLGNQRLQKVDSRDIEKTVAQANKDQSVVDRIASELEDLKNAPVKDEAAIKAKQGELAKANQTKADNMYKKSQRFGEIASRQGETEALRQFYLNDAANSEERDKRLAELNGQKGADAQKAAFDAAKRLAAQEAETESRTRLLADATKTLSLQTENLLRTYAVASAMLNRFADSITMIKDSAGSTANALSGKAQIGNVDRTNEKILNNIDAYSLEEVRGAAVQTGQLAGGGMAGETLQNQVLTAKVMQQALPEALANTNSENVGEVIDKMETAFKAAGVEFSAPIKEELKKSLESEVAGREGTSFSKLSGENDLIANVLKQTEAGLKAAQDFQKQYNDALSVAIDLQNNYAQALSDSIEYQIKSAQISADAAITLKETLGQTVTTEERNAAVDMEVRALTSTNVIPGGTTDPEQIFQQLMSGVAAQEDQKKELDRRQQVFASSPTDENKAKVAEQLQAMAKQNVAVNNTRKALEQLANDGRKAANALKDLQELGRISEGATNFTRNVLTAGPEEQAKIAKQLDAFTRFNSGQATQGDLNSLEFRQNVFGGGDLIKSVLPKEIADQLDAQTSLDMLRKMPGSDQVLKKVIGRVGNEDVTLESALVNKAGGKDPVQERYIKAYEDAVNVQAAAANKLGEAAQAVAQTFNDQMINVLNQIQTELPVILERAITSAMNPNASKAWKEMNNASKERQAMDQKQAVSMGLSDTQFNAVSTAYDSVQNAKNRTAALEKSQAEAAGFTGPNAVEEFRSTGGAKYDTFKNSDQYKRSLANEAEAQASFDKIATDNKLDSGAAMEAVGSYRSSSAYTGATAKIEEKRKLYEEARMGPRSVEPAGTLPQEVTERNPDIAEKEKRRAQAASAEEGSKLGWMGRTAVVGTGAAVGGFAGFRFGANRVRDWWKGGDASGKPTTSPDEETSPGKAKQAAETEAESRRATEAADEGGGSRKPKTTTPEAAKTKKRGWWPFGGETPRKAKGSTPDMPKTKGGRATAGRIAVAGAAAVGGYLFGSSGSSEASTTEMTPDLASGGDEASIILLLTKIEENTRMYSGESQLVAQNNSKESAQQESPKQVAETTATVAQALQQEFGTTEGLISSGQSMGWDAIGINSAIQDVRKPKKPNVKGRTSNGASRANAAFGLLGAGISARNWMETGNVTDAAFAGAGLLNAAGSRTNNRFVGAAGDALSLSGNAGRLFSGQSRDEGTIVQDLVSSAADATQIGVQMAPEIVKAVEATNAGVQVAKTGTSATTAATSVADDAVKAVAVNIADDAAKSVAMGIAKNVATKAGGALAVADLAYGGYKGYNDQSAEAQRTNAVSRTGYGILTGSAHTGDSLTGQLMGVQRGGTADVTLGGLESMARGAGAGAAIGTMVAGPAGTAVGAGVGAVVGGGAELVKNTHQLSEDRAQMSAAIATTQKMDEQGRTTQMVYDENTGETKRVARSQNDTMYGLATSEQAQARTEADMVTRLQAAKKLQASGGNSEDLAKALGMEDTGYFKGAKLEDIIGQTEKDLAGYEKTKYKSRTENNYLPNWLNIGEGQDSKQYDSVVQKLVEERLAGMNLGTKPEAPTVAQATETQANQAVALSDPSVVAAETQTTKATDMLSVASVDASKSLDMLSLSAQQFASMVTGGVQGPTGDAGVEGVAGVPAAETKPQVSTPATIPAPAAPGTKSQALTTAPIPTPPAPGTKPQVSTEGTSYDDLSRMSDAEMAEFMRTGVNPKKPTALEPRPELALRRATTAATQPQVTAQPQTPTEKVTLDTDTQKVIDANKLEKQAKVNMAKKQVEKAKENLAINKRNGATGEKSQAILDEKQKALADAEAELDRVYEGENLALEEARKNKQSIADVSGKKIQYTVDQAVRPQTSTDKPQEKPITPYEAQQKARREAYEADKKAKKDAYSEATRPFREKQAASLAATKERNRVAYDKRTAARQAEMAKAQEENFVAVPQNTSPGLEIFGPDPSATDPETERLYAEAAAEAERNLAEAAARSAIAASQSTQPSGSSMAIPQLPTTGPIPAPLAVTQTPQYTAQTVAADQAASGNATANPFTLSLDPSALAAFTEIKKSFESFGSYVTQLSEAAAKLPSKIELVGNTNHSVDIKISGAAALEMLDKKVKEYGETLVVAQIEQLRNEINKQFPGAVKSTGSGGKSTNASGGGSNPTA